jgi:nucleoside-diphosphate-sugar epimerase
VISMNALIALLERLIGKQAAIERHPPNAADMLNNWADVGKACNLLDWQPMVGLEEGVASMVNWYMAQRAWASQIKTS